MDAIPTVVYRGGPCYDLMVSTLNNLSRYGLPTSGGLPMRRILLAALALGLSPIPAIAAGDPDETALKAAGLSTDVPSLLDFIRLRSRETITADELKPLLKELASPDPKAADKAAAALVARGPSAVPSLRKAANDLADKPLADRARKVHRAH